MTFLRPDSLSTGFFLCIVAFVISAFLLAVYKSTPGSKSAAFNQTAIVALGLSMWLLLVSVPVHKGLLESKPFPSLMLFFGLVNIFGLAIAFSPMGKQIAMFTPIWALIAFQGFRLPLELVLHHWATIGSIPNTMTWSGYNFDIISGLLALVTAALVSKAKWLAPLFNFIGFVLLLNVMRVAMLSSPLPFAFAWHPEPELQLAFHLPYAWIAPVCVAGALSGHVLLFRALRLQPKRN